METQAQPTPSLKLPPQEQSWRQTLLSLLGTVMFGAVLVAACIFTLPNLINDWQIRDTAQPVAESRVMSGSCSTKLVFNICDATLAVRTKTGVVTHDVNYVFVDMHTGDYSVEIMADPAHPELSTTDMALDKLWNRTITLLVVGGILLALTITPIIAIIRRLRKPSAA
ncbi:hypothetical protein IAI18_06840 [Acetobacteraceae bacterium H6797]|nr:hypothetical protein [Acetobacteraceae bacterium H6797]